MYTGETSLCQLCARTLIYLNDRQAQRQVLRYCIAAKASTSEGALWRETLRELELKAAG